MLVGLGKALHMLALILASFFCPGRFSSLAFVWDHMWANIVGVNVYVEADRIRYIEMICFVWLSKASLPTSLSLVNTLKHLPATLLLLWLRLLAPGMPQNKHVPLLGLELIVLPRHVPRQEFPYLFTALLSKGVEDVLGHVEHRNCFFLVGGLVL